MHFHDGCFGDTAHADELAAQVGVYAEGALQIALDARQLVGDKGAFGADAFEAHGDGDVRDGFDLWPVAAHGFEHAVAHVFDHARGEHEPDTVVVAFVVDGVEPAQQEIHDDVGESRGTPYAVDVHVHDLKIACLDEPEMRLQQHMANVFLWRSRGCKHVFFLVYDG